MLSTMQDRPLTITSLFQHGARIHADSEVVTLEGDHVRRATFAEVARRAERLAGALARLGVGPETRVATFSWNTQEHMEAYLAVPCMGAVLHTLNIRLFPEQLAYVANHAEDEVVLVDASPDPAARPRPRGAEDGPPHRRHRRRATRPRSATCCATRICSQPRPIGFAWPDIDERAAAAMCYTSGTTGNPKGVVYGHRSTVLHSMMRDLRVGVRARGARQRAR